jgi:ABC-2 type transport system permease protein
MLKRLWTKTLYDQKRSLFFWNFGMLGIVIMTLAFYPAFEAEQEVFNSLTASMPEELLSIFGASGGDLASPQGFLNSQIYMLLIPLILIVYGVTNGVNTIAGEEGNGTLELLVTCPLSRIQIALEKYLALILGIIIIITLFTACIILFKGPIDLNMKSSAIIIAAVEIFTISLFFSSIAFALGTGTGNKGLSLGITYAIAVISYLWNALAPFLGKDNEQLTNLKNASVFHYYSGVDISTNNIDILEFMIISIISVVLVIISITLFRKRDIKN